MWMTLPCLHWQAGRKQLNCTWACSSGSTATLLRLKGHHLEKKHPDVSVNHGSSSRLRWWAVLHKHSFAAWSEIKRCSEVSQRFSHVTTTKQFTVWCDHSFFSLRYLQVILIFNTQKPKLRQILWVNTEQKTVSYKSKGKTCYQIKDER